MSEGDRQAWIVRMHTGGGDMVDVGVRDGKLLLGWSDAKGLVNTQDYWDFREIVHLAHYLEDTDYRRSGRAASQLWNFIHEMTVGDLVVVPYSSAFYVGEVAGPAVFVPEGVSSDTAHCRPVAWLGGGAAIPRTSARSALISRMKSYLTVTSASDLTGEILEALGAAERTDAPTLAVTLRQALIDTTKQQLLTGHMDERRFEELVRDLFLALGAIDARIVPRRKDIGADIEAEFSVGYLVTIPMRIQVKYWRGDADPYPIDQVLRAITDGDVEIGVVVTTATFTEVARQYAAEQSLQTGKQLALVDGDELCGLIVDHGLDSLMAARRA